MTQYSKVSIGVQVSDNSDMSSSTQLNALTYTPSTLSQTARYTVSAATGGTTIDLAAFASVDYVVVKNKDTVNYVTLTFTTNSGSAANSHRIVAGKVAIEPDVKVSGDLVLTANTSACECEVTIVGA